MPSPAIEVKNLSKTYGSGDSQVQVLKGIHLKIHPGTFTTLMGPSGAGKSTLLQLIGGLDTATSGEIFIADQPIHQLSDDDLTVFRRRSLGFVFQFFNLIPSLTALENVCLPLLLDGKSLPELRERATQLLTILNLKHRLDHRPHQLSGGEMQRVAIARALMNQPKIILADEPTGNLDSKNGQSVLETLQRLVRQDGQTLVMVTHDRTAASYGDRIVTLRDGQVESDLNL